MAEYYTTDEVAEKLHISSRSVRGAINRNELIAVKIGKVFRVSEEDLNRWIEKNKTGQETK